MTLKPYYKKKGITIYHGDSVEVLRHLNGLDAIITDPPYSSGGLHATQRKNSPAKKYMQTGTNFQHANFSGDNRDQRSFTLWASIVFQAAIAASRPGSILASFIDWRQLPSISDAIQCAGWIWRGTGVWSKKYGRPYPGRFSNACEYLVWGSNGPMDQRKVYPCGIVECAPLAGKAKHHMTQKPDAVMDWAISIVPPGSIICDPFMGSGSTLVAARKAGQKAIGIECDESMCQVAIERIEDECANKKTAA